MSNNDRTKESDSEFQTRTNTTTKSSSSSATIRTHQGTTDASNIIPSNGSSILHQLALIESTNRQDVDFSYSPRSHEDNAVTATTATPLDLIPYLYPAATTASSVRMDNDTSDPLPSSLPPPADRPESSNHSSNQYLVSEDSERQILLLMLLAQVCALHDATPRTFIVHVLSLFERGILDHQSIRFLFDLDLVPQDALMDFNRISALYSNSNQRTSTNPASETIPNKKYPQYSDAIVPYTSSPPGLEKGQVESSDSLDSTKLFPQSTVPISACDKSNIYPLPQQLEPSSVTPATALQEYLLERKAREASVSAIRKVLERHDSNDFSTASRHQQHTTTQTTIPNSKSSISTVSHHSSVHLSNNVAENNGSQGDNNKQHLPVKSEMNNSSNAEGNDRKEDRVGGLSEDSCADNDSSSSSVVSVPAPRLSSSTLSWAVEHHPLSLSRYQREFTQIKKLASGSFGEVFHVINKLDHREYAMKRVMFSATGFSNDTVTLVLREVRCLAQCDHPNCVRYYTSWLEPSWMTGSGIPVSTPDQIVGVTKATQRQVLTDIHQLVALSSAKDLEKPQGPNEEEILVTQHLQHIDELLFGGRHHLQLLKPATAVPNKQQKLLLTSPPYQEESDSSCSTSECSADDDRTIGRNEYYYNGGSSIGFTFQQSSNCTNEPSGHTPSEVLSSVLPRRHRHRDRRQRAAGHSLVPTNKTPYASRYNYHICLYIQMQLCHSRTLSDWIQQRNLKAQQAPEALDIHQWALDVYQTFRQIVCGLAHVHGKGIIHRDLKPANIFAADDGVFKIGDFGLSKLLMFRNASSETQVSTTSSGVLPLNIGSEISPSLPCYVWGEEAGHINNTIGVGTLTYASPEQLRSHEYCSKADIFSLGLILLELCCNFVTEHERAQVFHEVRIAHTVPRKIERLFPRAAKLILACTDRDPKNRPSANDILSDDILQESNTEILRLKVELRKKDFELEQCKAMLHEKDLIIDDLRRQLMLSEAATSSQ